MKTEPGKVTARGSEGESAFTAGEFKDARAKHRFLQTRWAGTSLLS